jgi:hypothetical protein
LLRTQSKAHGGVQLAGNIAFAEEILVFPVSGQRLLSNSAAGFSPGAVALKVILPAAIFV